MKKERDVQPDAKQEFPEQISSGCLTFTSHELFWKELETIVVDSAQLTEE
ncbi:hypothetical protein [Bacillus sp. JJ1562]